MKNFGKGLSLLQLIPRKKFNELAKEWGVDKYIREFTTWKQICVLVLSYIMHLENTRDVEATFKIPKSTFNDANLRRCSGFFEEVCKLILWEIHDKNESRKTRKAIRTILAIDSTECSVHGAASRLKKWKSKLGSKKAKVKIHVVWNVNDEWISDFKITPCRFGDSTIGKLFKILRGKTYVFDRAYNDLGFWYNIVKEKSHFVTRLKDCTRRRYHRNNVLKHNEEQSGVLWDGTWKPDKECLRSHPEVPKNFHLRHIIYRDKLSKKVFDFITSDWNVSAQCIADIYKKRWAVELLFRWLKGHLGIRTFTAKTPNAIEIFASIAVLVQLLVRLFKLVTNFKGSLAQTLRNIRTEINIRGLENSPFSKILISIGLVGQELSP